MWQKKRLPQSRAVRIGRWDLAMWDSVTLSVERTRAEISGYRGTCLRDRTGSLPAETSVWGAAARMFV